MDLIRYLSEQELLRLLLTFIIVVLGFLNMLWGYRLFRFSLTVLGFFYGAVIGIHAMDYFFPGAVDFAVYGMLGGAVVGCIFGLFIFKVGLFLLGFSTAFTLLTPIFKSWEPTLGLICLILLSVITAFLALKFVRVMLMLGTALLGAFWMIYGMGTFLEGPDLLKILYTPGALSIAMSGNLAYFLTSLGCGVVGFVYQLWRFRNEQSIEILN
jgi:hypothetical protein